MEKPEALLVVEELNSKLYEQHQKEFPSFAYISTGDWEGIMFEERLVWNTENDSRRFDEKKNDYEPLLPFFIKEWNKKIKELAKLKLK